MRERGVRGDGATRIGAPTDGVSRIVESIFLQMGVRLGVGYSLGGGGGAHGGVLVNHALLDKNVSTRGR